MAKTAQDNLSTINELRDLKTQQLIYEKILEISEDGFLIVDKDGYIIEINHAYSKFLGLSRNDILGKHVLEIIKNSKLPKILSTGEVDINVVHQLVEGQAPNNEKYTFVTRAPVKDGDQIIAAVGQVKFSLKTMELTNKLQRLDMELQYYKKELERIAGSKYFFDNMIGRNPDFLAIKKIAQKATKNDFTVLLTGETGTGKEVFANAIHYGSIRRNKPFVRINCAAIPSELLESELFGYTEGSFTGAKRGGKKGKFELANGGTIFLDEIGDMPLSMQAKLLRVLQEKEIERVGGYETIPIDVRVIAATNQNLEDKVNNHSFREDLYYRLNVIQAKIPSLRERSEDIPYFIEYFLKKLNEKYEAKIQIDPEAIEILSHYQWPGNIRELKNIIERSFALVDDHIIRTTHLPPNILSNVKRHFLMTTCSSSNTLNDIMDKIEKELILSSLNKNHHNCRKTAEELGIHRSTLYKKMDKHQIQRKE
ncbi:sigma-54 interaction domain-containing protein [Anaerosolibacter sp.]|uniref:sigma-54 interaction domain-containing protein n=1 Tax=Anaerosolibacter sp. TaxID=1872527 RepID=UPI0039F0D121